MEHNVRCVVVGFIADMAAAATKGVSGLDKAGLGWSVKPLRLTGIPDIPF